MQNLLIALTIGVIIYTSEALELKNPEESIVPLQGREEYNAKEPLVAQENQEETPANVDYSGEESEKEEIETNGIKDDDTKYSVNGSSDVVAIGTNFTNPNDQPQENQEPKIENKSNIFISSSNSSVDVPVDYEPLTDDEEVSKIVNRDLDSFYDNELIMKVSDDQGNIPESFEINLKNDEPFLISKRNRIPDGDVIQKRSVESDNVTEKVKSKGFMDIKKQLTNIRKIFRKEKMGTTAAVVSFEKKRTSLASEVDKRTSLASEGGIVSVNVTEFKVTSGEVTESAEEDRGSTVTAETVLPNFERILEHEVKTGVSASVEIVTGTPKSAAEASDVVPKEFIGSSKDSLRSFVESQRSSGLADPGEGALAGDGARTLAKRRSPCDRGGTKMDQEQCLPTGGAPKYQPFSFDGGKNDSDYQKFLSGDLVEKLVKNVLSKVTRNSRMTAEFGLCEADLKDVRDQYNKIRATNKDCCKKVVDELQCFLTWMLTYDPRRRKRSADAEMTQEEQEVQLDAELESLAHTPSPQYNQLHQRIDECRMNGVWDYDNMNQEIP